MSFLDDLTGGYKPKVSKDEFKEVCSSLSSKGFSERELDEVKKIFRPDLEEPVETEKGIDKTEIDNAIKWMKEHKDDHCIPSSKLSILEETLKKRL